MIKFFRKIRQNLLSEGKTGKYFKYAIGEIFLVVIGILIALQINNWNESRKADIALKEYLVKIKSNTLEDIIELDSLTIGRRQIAELCKQARTSILDKTEDENTLLFMSSGWAFIDLYFCPSTGGYEALKNSNYYGKINNTALDSLLTRYHTIIGEIELNEKSYNEYAESQEAYLSTQFDRSLVLAYAFVPPDSLYTKATSQTEYFTDFKNYTSFPAFRNVISLAAWQFDTMIHRYSELKDVGLSIIQEIDKIIED
ncbi:DUF6090 family protein [Croceivirga thetidis]|uniref:Uncharacterized protein n=1 Tax=Croceivirga thetidis TaxID=2721623 RepID=A0ABX1GN62_9FLAO|nr:DUF6090 family protein [Croceivirga thetidis]NKI30420.1 hypothetical protein [Croceivirga thetidis]